MISTDSLNKRRSSFACYFLFDEVASRVPFRSSSLHSRLRPQASCSVMCSFCAKRCFSFSSIFDRRYLVTYHTPQVSRSTSSKSLIVRSLHGKKKWVEVWLFYPKTRYEAARLGSRVMRSVCETQRAMASRKFRLSKPGTPRKCDLPESEPDVLYFVPTQPSH
jgi:hypothetical protein